MGSLVAGLTFGALRGSLPIEKQFFIGILVTAVTGVLPVFSTDVYVLSAMLFIAGISFAPTMVVVMKLGTIIIPASRMTEGLTWMTTGISIGVALGGIQPGKVQSYVRDAVAGGASDDGLLQRFGLAVESHAHPLPGQRLGDGLDSCAVDGFRLAGG